MDRTRADTAGSDAKKPSPVRTQWEALKRQHPGRILLFQLGDFYETFEGDARTLARVCGITLTSRELSKGDRVPLAGIPIHRAAHNRRPAHRRSSDGRPGRPRWTARALTRLARTPRRPARCEPSGKR